jgi:hypothetical protein
MTARSKPAALPLPPFSRELLAAKRRRESLNVFLHAGDRSWDRARKRLPPHVLCCPPDADFAAFDWSCVERLHLTLVVWNREWSFVDGFARHLVISGAALVVAIGGYRAAGEESMRSHSTIYKPKFVASAA